MPRSIAFKCTYNDGKSQDSRYVGFSGTCSRDNIVTNIAKKVWCSNLNCECYKFYGKGLKGPIPIAPCNESVLFVDWKFGAGIYHNGPKKGMLISINDTGAGEIAFITTRLPGECEDDRRIIGFFEIDHVEEKNVVFANERTKIQLTEEESLELYFWAYHKNKRNVNKCRWDTLLFRYLEDDSVHRILIDISLITKDLEQRDKINQLILKKFGNRIAPEANGVIADKSKTLVKRRMSQAWKYGGGGEGEDHLQLKNLVASKPELIGLPKKSKPYIEHLFTSGDCVDIMFVIPDGRKVAVEIETTTPLPGARQKGQAAASKKNVRS